MFTVNDVSHGGCKYGIMSFSSSSRGSLSVEMCDNLYFTNRKVGVFLRPRQGRAGRAIRWPEDYKPVHKEI